MKSNILYLLLIKIIYECESARILAYYPTPAHSHQSVFRPLTIELLNRGHEVTHISPNPVFTRDTHENLTEIDVHDVSYEIAQNFKKSMLTDEAQKFDLNVHGVRMFYANLFEAQIKTPQVQEFLFGKKQQFDLILIEEISLISLAVSHVYNAPVILISSYGALNEIYDILGAQMHPIYYQSSLNKRIYNLTFWEKVHQLYEHYWTLLKSSEYDDEENKVIQKLFGPEVPTIRELHNNVHMLFVNVHPIWVENRPVPPNVVYLGGFHQTETKELPQDLQSYLDSSKHGVIYISFGTSATSSMLPADKIEILARVVGQLPHDVLWKWDEDKLPGQSGNTKLSKWVPQADLLKHPKVKLFITQAGLQSTDEAITAGVPLVAFPVSGDQWYNAEKYVRHGIGQRVLFEEATESVVRDAIVTVLSDESYRNNIITLRSIMSDEPQTPMERAIFWVEHVIRHKGATHLRAATAHMSWAQYFEIELLVYLLAIVFTLSLITSIALLYLCKLLFRNNVSKLKQN